MSSNSWWSQLKWPVQSVQMVDRVSSNGWSSQLKWQIDLSMAGQIRKWPVPSDQMVQEIILYDDLRRRRTHFGEYIRSFLKIQYFQNTRKNNDKIL
mgnify:FL=1